jgi:hypothetical protein
MRLGQLNGAQLTYCTNVHPGETLAEVRQLLREHVAGVRSALVPDGDFGVGLRLAAAAAQELGNEAERARFKAELDDLNLYCFTINGFPYGAFHGTRVKERVYEPDWLTHERVRYTQSLAQSLAAMLPLGVSGSISTVPGCFKPVGAAPGAPQRMADALVDVAVTLVDIARRQGRHIALALEPEPHCFLETTSEAVSFFEQYLFGPQARQRLSKAAGVEPAEAERLLRRHLGVCLDTCHASVEFETPLDAWRALTCAGIAVPKVQISAGLRLPEATPERLAALAAFAEGVYLHQTVVKTRDGLRRFLDLPEALAAAAPSSDEWRVHFHVPIFLAELGLFQSTQADLLPLLAELAHTSGCPHLEVETYTWDVLPEAFRNVPVDRAIERELRFVIDAMGRALEARAR